MLKLHLCCLYCGGSAAVMSLRYLGQRYRVLGGATDVYLILVHFNLEARGKESVEAHDEIRVTFEEVRNTADDSGSVDTGGRKEQ